MKNFFVFTFFLPFLGLAEKLEIGSYNVQNLFDAKHDWFKDDYEFLPVQSRKYKSYIHKKCNGPRNDYDKQFCENPRPIDWTNKKVDLKISQIKKVLKSRGRLPDILALTEVENRSVLRKLAKELGYKGNSISMGPDKRGIDVALLYNNSKNLKREHSFYAVKKHKINAGKDFQTRPILEVKFKLMKGDDVKDLHVFVNHWPSQHAPDSNARMLAAKKLKELMNKRSQTNPEALLIATGDFNTTYDGVKDIPHPFRDELLVDSDILDVLGLYKESILRNESNTNSIPKGTYYYAKGNQWNHFDRFFVSPNLVDGRGVEVLLSSYEIYAPKFLTKTHYQKDWSTGEVLHSEAQTPIPYNHRATEEESAGFSDHFPVFMKVAY